MAKRGRPRKLGSLDRLIGELKALDVRRREVVLHIRRATDALLSGESPFPWGKQPVRASAASATSGTGQRRRRRKMSAAARKRISDAQKARWAKQRAGKK